PVTNMILALPNPCLARHVLKSFDMPTVYSQPRCRLTRVNSWQLNARKGLAVVSGTNSWPGS
ncbi:MAG: hypothetical protein ACRDGF_06955, partial [Chloroflexota bacterium]